MEKTEQLQVMKLISVLQHIRSRPGETAEEILLAMTQKFNNTVIEPEWLGLALRSFEAAEFIRHEHNAERDCVWLQVEPVPVKNSDLRNVTIEVGEHRYDVYTSLSPSELARAMLEEGTVLTFDDISGQPFFLIRAEKLNAAALGSQVASALQ